MHETQRKAARRKKTPREFAVIFADRCTGCEACVEVCPVDCIIKVAASPATRGLHAWCEVDLDRCIGCQLCVRIPSKKSEVYELLVCPWGAIEMIPLEGPEAAVGELGGPPEHAIENRERRLAAARRQSQPTTKG